MSYDGVGVLPLNPHRSLLLAAERLVSDAG